MTHAPILNPVITEFTLLLRGLPATFRAHASHPPLEMLGDSAPLTVVSGPPLSGRSTLLRALLERRGGLLVTSDMEVFPGHPLHRALPHDTLTVKADQTGQTARERIYISATQLREPNERAQATLLAALRSPHAHLFAEPEVTRHLLRNADLFAALRERLVRGSVTLCTGPLDTDTLRITESLSRNTHYLSMQGPHPAPPAGMPETSTLVLNGERYVFSGEREGNAGARLQVVTGANELTLRLMTCAQHERTGGLLLTSDLTDVTGASHPHVPGSFEVREHLLVTPDRGDLDVKLRAAMHTNHPYVYLNVPLALMALTHPSPIEALRFGVAQVFLPVVSPGARHGAEFVGALRETYGMPPITSLQNCHLSLI